MKALMKARDVTFRAGEIVAIRMARMALAAGIKKAKATYGQRMQDHFWKKINV